MPSCDVSTGASFVATKVIDLLNEKNRVVYLCDSFSGIPEVKTAKHAADREAHEWAILNKNSVELVERDALMFGLKKDYMRFVKGYFNESLPAIIEQKPSVKFAVARFDGDTYDSTMQALQVIYPHISPGGYVIVDDYSDWISCREAVDEYRSMHNITTPMVLIPYAKGGKSTEDNLRLRCRTHNRLAAIESFGRAKVAAHVPNMKRQ